ncbi:MAG: hypothetical protein L3J73_00935, partial [Thermoplasmata archaeon]|nr:hypothetical protein [Thermoplasmata archaeon]
VSMAAAPTLAIPTVRSIPSVVPPSPLPPALPAVRPPRPRPAPPSIPLFPETPALFPWMARRFAPGEATLWVGPARATESLLEILYAGCAAAGGRISLLEGANRFHPYRIGERGRSFGLDPGETLDRIRLARAFTAYQMIALVDGWAREVRRTRPTFLVAHEIPSLFFESEFPEEERAPLLTHAARTLAALARSTRLPMLITSATGFAGFPGLRDAGPTLFDLVRLTLEPGGLALEAYREATRIALVHRPDGQRGLEEFVGAIAGEVTAWDGPYQRTARRSRSG